MTKFEGEIIVMTLDMLHADVITMVNGGSSRPVEWSILHVVLCHRGEWAREERACTARTS